MKWHRRKEKTVYRQHDQTSYRSNSGKCRKTDPRTGNGRNRDRIKDDELFSDTDYCTVKDRVKIAARYSERCL